MGSIGSGLDIGGIVSQLVAAEGAPALRRIDFREKMLNIELSGYSKLKSDVSGFRDQVTKLLKPQDLKARSGSVADTTIATVSVTDSATSGNYDLVVTDLAASQKLASKAFAAKTTVVGSGTLTINFGEWNAGETAFTADGSKTALTVVIDPAANTLTDVKDAINNANGAVRASIVNDGTGERLLLSSTSTGVTNGLEITVVDDDTNNTDGFGLSQLAFTVGAKGNPDNMATTQVAKDAAFTIDGLSITSESNTVTTALEGTTLTLKDVGTTTVNVSDDSAALKNQLNAFMARYNSMVMSITELTGYNADTGEAGLLQGDSAPRIILSTVRTAFLTSTTVSSGNTYSLTTLGYTTGADGKLKVDDTKIDAALKDNYSDMVEFFGDATAGLAKKLDDFLGSYVGSTGSFVSRADGLNAQLDRLKEDRSALGRRLEKVEKRYMREFTNLDIVMATLQSSADFLDSQLSSLQNFGKKR